MKSKGFISVILIFLLSFSNVFNTFAHFSDIEDSLYKGDILDLYELGIVNGKEDGKFDPDDQLTRAEFCAVLARLNGLDSNSIVSSRQYFSDVAPDHPFFDEIGFAASQNFVNGYPDGNFYPDAYISYDQVNKIIIDFLGYRFWAQSQGGYPMGYRIQARSLDLSDGLDLSYEVSINRGELCKFINNALDVPLVETIGIEGEDIVYEKNEDKTILTQYLKLKKVEGFVEANSFFGLYDAVADNDCIMIDGVNYRINDTAMNSYIGKNVTAIVKINENKKLQEILTIEDEEGNDILLTHENNISYDDYALSYDTADNKQKSAKLDSNVKLIYNGEEKIFDKDYINNLTSGTVRLISKNQSSVYDIVIVSEYTSFVVDSKNEYRQIVYGPGKTKSFDFSKDIVYNIADISGKMVSFADVSVGSVITYFENSSFAEGFVSNYTVSGTLSELGEENGTPCAVINDQKIKLNQDTKTRVASYGLGSQVKLYMNIFDCAIYADKAAIRTDKIKYLFKIGNSSETGLDSVLMGKFYDLDNGIEVLEFAEDVRVNGTTIKNAKASDITISIPQMIQIKMNEENKVTSITTAKSYQDFMTNPGNDGFCEVFGFDTKTFFSDSDSFDNKILFDRGTAKFMIVPEDMSNYEDKHFRTETYSYFTNGEEYNVAAYNNNKAYEFCDVIVCKIRGANQQTNVELHFRDKLFTVAEISKAANDDGEVCTKITGYVGSEETYFYIDPEDNIVDDTLNAEDMEIGDVIFCSINSDNYLKGFKRFYNKDTGFEQKISYSSLDSRIVIMDTEAARMTDSHIYFLDKAGANPYDYYMIKAKEQVTIVEQRGGETVVSAGTLSDIEPGDRLIMHVCYVQFKTVVVFK